MKLYRIRNKQTGRFLCDCCTNSPAFAKFNTDGIFWRRIDTIKKHLVELCTDYTWIAVDGSERGHKSGMLKPIWSCKTVAGEFHRDRLKLYDVIINDVTIDGEEIIQAKDLVKQ